MMKLKHISLENLFIKYLKNYILKD